MKRSINIGKMIVFPYESYSNYINLPARCLERLSNLQFIDISEKRDSYKYIHYLDSIFEQIVK